MKALREYLDELKETLGCLVPVSNKRKKFFMDEVRQRVIYYQPRIEDKTGINLGRVEVREDKYHTSDVLASIANESVFKTAAEQGRIPTEFDFWASSMVAAQARIIGSIPIWLMRQIRTADFRVHDGVIYVPFNFMNRISDYSDFRARRERLDYGVVHELSHILWDRLSKDDASSCRDGRRWFEGFATYCAENYFASFYPKGARKSFSKDLPSKYTDELFAVEKVLQKHGNDFLLEIPLRWKQLSKTG